MLLRIIDFFCICRVSEGKIGRFLDMQRKIILRLSILIICHKFILTYLESTLEKQEKGKKKCFNCCKLWKFFHLSVNVKFCYHVKFWYADIIQSSALYCRKEQIRCCSDLKPVFKSVQMDPYLKSHFWINIQYHGEFSDLLL